LNAVELLAILGAAIGGCALVWFETGRQREFLAAATVLIGALLVGGLLSVLIS
jgi:hypothetical protein